MYGIWDRGEIAPATANKSMPRRRVWSADVTNVVNETGHRCSRSCEIVSANPVNYMPDAGVVPGVYGWYFDFDRWTRPLLTLQGISERRSGWEPLRRQAQFPGERAIRRFVPRGSSLLVTTVIPRDANTCLRFSAGVYVPDRCADRRQRDTADSRPQQRRR